MKKICPINSQVQLSPDVPIINNEDRDNNEDDKDGKKRERVPLFHDRLSNQDRNPKGGGSSWNSWFKQRLVSFPRWSSNSSFSLSENSSEENEKKKNDAIDTVLKKENIEKTYVCPSLARGSIASPLPKDVPLVRSQKEHISCKGNDNSIGGGYGEKDLKEAFDSERLPLLPQLVGENVDRRNFWERLKNVIDGANETVSNADKYLTQITLADVSMDYEYHLCTNSPTNASWGRH